VRPGTSRLSEWIPEEQRQKPKNGQVAVDVRAALQAQDITEGYALLDF
jgi:hypothetical protein